MDHLIECDPKRPDIDPTVVTLLIDLFVDDFWGDIVRSAILMSENFVGVGAEAKIGDLVGGLPVDNMAEDVFRLDVSVDYIEVVEEVEPGGNLLEDVHSLFFWNDGVLTKIFVKAAGITILRDDQVLFGIFVDI